MAQGYGFALLTGILPLGLKLLFDAGGLGKASPFLLLLPAVILSSWFGGWGPGLLATGITLAGADVLFLPSYGEVAKTPDAWLSLAIYAAEALLVAWLMAAFRRSQRDHARSLADEHVARAELEAARRIGTWIHTSPNPMVSFDMGGRITGWNPAAEALFGWSEPEMIGRPGPESWEQALRLLTRALQGEPVTDEDAILGKKDGASCEVRVSLAPMHDGRRRTCGAMAVLVDVTERKRMERELQHQARHDSLTGLPNRTLFFEALQQRLESASQDAAPVSLLLMDLNGFKEVNDTFGHHYGDLLLRDVGARLHEVLRRFGLVARLGGDEFAAVLSGRDAEGAALVAGRVLAALTEPFELAGRQLSVGTSIGVAVYPVDGADAHTLLQHADAAMYAAKRSQRGHVAYSSAAPQEATREIVDLATLRRVS